MRLREIFGTNLRRLRHASGLSQEELAHRAGINRNYVGLLERAANSPTLDTIERLAEELAVDPVQFFEKPGGR
jgi:transcriptional regulator with XRE-family HTH domain